MTLTTDHPDFHRLIGLLRDKNRGGAELSQLSGIPSRRVSDLLHHAARLTAPKVWRMPRNGRKVIWTVTAPMSYGKSPPRYVPPWRELTPESYDIRAHMRMAVAGR